MKYLTILVVVVVLCMPAMARTVYVMDHGLVDLNNLYCTTNMLSNTIHYVCYDRDEHYLVIGFREDVPSSSLSRDVWHGWCNVDMETVQGFNQHDTAAKHFKENIEGKFKCTYVPHYVTLGLDGQPPNGN